MTDSSTTTVNMPEPARQVCTTALSELLTSRESINIALLTTRDGRPCVFKARHKGHNTAKLSAMIASLSSLAQSILSETSDDVLDLVVLEGEQSKLVSLKIQAGNGLLVLAVVADASVNLGRMLNDTRACAAKVAATFRSA